jgi:hypothetical protein
MASETGYRLRLYPYSGGYTDYVEGDRATCRWRASRRIKSHRNYMEYPVSLLERGVKWELETGEDACMIGDSEGILCIEEIEEPEVEECEEDESEFVVACEDCGDEFPPDQLTDGLCYECWGNLDDDEKEEDDE